MDDLISRYAAIAVADSSDYVGLSVEDCKKVTDEVVKGLRQLPSAQPLTEEDYIELHDRFGTYVEEVVRDMINGEGKRWGNERRHDQQTGGDPMGKNRM